MRWRLSSQPNATAGAPGAIAFIRTALLNGAAVMLAGYAQIDIHP
jgi:hypothetical protein